MEVFLEFVKGSMFRFSFTIMVLGIIRLIIISVYEIRKTAHEAGDSDINYVSGIGSTLAWLLPIKNLLKTDSIFSIVSFVFHVGLLTVPLFLLEHVMLIYNSAGIWWPVLDSTAANIMTAAVIITGIILLGYRIISYNRRFVSTPLDYILLLLILLTFLSGFSTSFIYNPFSYSMTMIIHVVSGNIIMILIPFSRLSHAVLYPVTKIATETAWHFQPDTGKRVNKLLYGKEQKNI